jgi:ATP-dependent Clp protease ATP-binding subunit ClpC
MFERYTEKARQAIFQARYEASVMGSAYIETNQMLLGLLRADRDLGSIVEDREALRQELGIGAPREKISTSVDLPLSHTCKQALAFGAEEAERASHRSISTLHLLAGLLRTAPDDPAHAALARRGITLDNIRARMSKMPTPDHHADDAARSHRDPLGSIPNERRAAAQEILLALAGEPEIEIIVNAAGETRSYRFTQLKQ